MSYVAVVIQSIGHSNTILPEILGYGAANPTNFWDRKPRILILSEDPMLNSSPQLLSFTPIPVSGSKKPMPFLGQEQLDSSLQINKPVRGDARHLGSGPVVAEVALSSRWASVISSIVTQKACLACIHTNLSGDELNMFILI